MLSIFAGVLMLLAGIFLMRYSLKKALWRRLRSLLKKAAGTPGRALLTGIAASAACQSSSTVCLLALGLVSGEYMTFPQALGLVLGANIGTCSTVQLINLSPPIHLLLPCLMITITLSFFRKTRYAAMALTGFLSMLAGLSFLAQGISQLSAEANLVSSLMLAKVHPIYAIWSGILITIAFQSSSAATALIMLLAGDGLLDLPAAAYIVYGNNIGSCFSSVLFSAAAPIAARRVALSHILLNGIGVALFFPLTGPLLKVTELFSTDFGNQVALFHLLFNLLSSLLAFLLLQPFIRLILCLLPDRRR